jgi:hypothetical protein
MLAIARIAMRLESPTEAWRDPDVPCYLIFAGSRKALDVFPLSFFFRMLGPWEGSLEHPCRTNKSIVTSPLPSIEILARESSRGSF